MQEIAPDEAEEIIIFVGLFLDRINNVHVLTFHFEKTIITYTT